MDVKRFIISGTCVCGHSWEDHHLGMILNKPIWDEMQKRWPDHPPYVPQECEYYGCNEYGGLDAEGNPHCFQYTDVDSVDD